MRKLAWILSFMFILFVGASAAWAPCLISGYVYCDVNQNGVFDAAEDIPFPNIQILAGGSPITPVDGEPSVTTDSDGYYEVLSHDVCGAIISLDETTLPGDAMFVNPSTNGVSPDVGTDWLIDSAICHPNPAIDIRKQEEGPDSRTFAYGADVTFTIVVTNTGDVDLINVEVTDVMVADCDRSIGDLAIGESVSYDCTDTYVDEGYENIACVSGSADEDVVEDCDPSTVVIDYMPAIDIRKQDEGPDSRIFVYGTDVTFEIEVVNTGNMPLTNVEVSDDLVPDCNYFVGDLDVGDSISFECTAPYATAGFENIACVSGFAGDTEVTDCDPSTVVIRGGGDGCTPGYWKQSHHFDDWTDPYTPDMLFADVFDDAFPDKTLLDVLSQGGGHLNALGRHTVAALLNAASPGVSYDLTVDSVIEMFNAVYPGGNYERLKDYFEKYNQQGCPLNNDKNGGSNHGGDNGRHNGSDNGRHNGWENGRHNGNDNGRGNGRGNGRD